MAVSVVASNFRPITAVTTNMLLRVLEKWGRIFSWPTCENHGNGWLTSSKPQVWTEEKKCLRAPVSGNNCKLNWNYYFPSTCYRTKKAVIFSTRLNTLKLMWNWQIWQMMSYLMMKSFKEPHHDCHPAWKLMINPMKKKRKMMCQKVGSLVLQVTTNNSWIKGVIL